MLKRCNKIGFWICLLILLIVVCTWRYIHDPLMTTPAAATHEKAAIVITDADAMPDQDHDGLSDADEIRAGLNPILSDTDADGKKDGIEGLTADRDHDGIIDALESALDDSDLDGVPDELDAENTDPDNDTDGDRYGNALEKAEGTDPLDARSMPADRDRDGVPDNIDADKKPISFVVTKQGAHVQLRGSFANVPQIHALQSALHQEGIVFENGVILQDKYLEEGESISAAQKLIPKFLSLYQNGTFAYVDGAFEINGDVATEADMKEMDAFLAENAGLVHYTNETHVRTPQPPKGSQKDPIAFELTKKGSLFTLEGVFGSAEEISALQKSFDEAGVLYQKGKLAQDDGREGERVIALTQKLIPAFAANYRSGAIRFQNNQLTVSGEVPTPNDKNMMERLLAANAQGVAYRNDTRVVPPPAVSDAERQAFQQEIGSILRDARITFESGSSRLTPEGEAIVKQIGTILQNHPDIRVEIAGYTDSDGDDAANLKLSQERVNRVLHALEKLQIDPFRLRAKGYGESDPVVPNDSAENKAKNRRVEFKIIGE